MKGLIILIISIFYTLILSSQDFYGGIKAGLVASQVDGDSYGGFRKIAPFAGLYVRNTFNERWGGQLGIDYKHKGSKDVRKRNGITISYYEIRLDYIEVPVLATYKLNRFRIPSLFDIEIPNDFFIEIGVSYAYLLKATENFGDGDFLPQGREFKNYDISTQAGIIYRLSDRWLANLRWSYTFFMFPIRNHPGNQTFWVNRGEYNRNINLSLMYEF